MRHSLPVTLSSAARLSAALSSAALSLAALSSAGLLSAALLAPGVAIAQPAPPSPDDIARALSRPAASPAAMARPAPIGPGVGGDPLQVTAAMLKGPTRGIVPAQPAAMPTAGAPRPAANSATNPCPPDSGVCALYVEFETGSAGLTSSALLALDNLGKALASLNGAGFRFRVEGHTDTVGSDAFNRSLSELRAETVTTYLNQHFAIDRTRLQPVGLGKDHPLIPTADQTPEPRNRRVQVINLGA